MKLFVYLILFGFVASAQTIEDVALIKNKIIKYEKSIESSIKENEVPDILSMMDDSGKWKDINYQDQKPGGWEPSKHISRLYGITKLFTDSGSVYFKDDKVLNWLINGLKGWGNHKHIFQFQ